MADKMLVLRGKVHWAKIVGGARPYTGNPKYDKGPSWSVDLTPDEASLAKLKAAGIADKLKTPKGEKETRTEPYLRLTILENRADGKKNDAPKVSDITGKAWDGSEIGNESVMDIKVKVKDYGSTVGVYYQEARVLKHEVFERGGFEPLSPDDEFFGGGKPLEASSKAASGKANIDDLDEDLDLPF